MALLTHIFNKLKVPISPSKTVGPTTCLEYLGVILDSSKMEARLLKDKIDRIIEFISTLLNKKSYGSLSSNSTTSKSGARNMPSGYRRNL
jgi:hypothetical protein